LEGICPSSLHGKKNAFGNQTKILNPHHLESDIFPVRFDPAEECRWSADVGKYLEAACSVWAFLLKICHF